MDRVTLKQKAKESLQGRYGDAITLFVIYMLIAGACGGVVGAIMGTTKQAKSVEGLLTLVISSLFIMGFYNYFLKVSRNEKVEWKELFNKTDLFVPALLITLLVGVFVTLWSLLLLIPGIIAAFSYSQVYFVKLDNPDMEAMDVLKKSKELMNGHKMDYFVLILSFLGWIILGLFTLGILYLWLMPYMYVTQANFYNELIKKK